MSENTQHINKEGLAAQLATQAGMSKQAATDIITALFGILRDELQAGNPVEIRGFGRFSLVQRADRVGKNPHTGEKVYIAARRVVRFKPGKDLKKV